MTETIISSPVGPLRLVATGGKLVALTFGGGADTDGGGTDPDREVLRRAVGQLEAYFAGRRQRFDLPLRPEGTEFQRRTWRALEEIPFGETISYAELAARVGRPNAVRAVGAANGRNPISILIPCHRVIGSDGRLTGYAGGLPAKRHLLELEGSG